MGIEIEQYEADSLMEDIFTHEQIREDNLIE